MTSIQVLQDRISSGELIILDGAIGTELERLGAPMHQDVWCGHALDTHPELVSQVHQSYIDAGADVITANTYATCHQALKLGGLEDKMEPWNALATQLACQARDASDRPVCVAGSVSTFMSTRGFAAEQLRPYFAEQAGILADNGADLLLLETLGASAEVVGTAVEECLDFGLPVWVAVSCMEDRETGQVMHGVEESQKSDDARSSYEPLASAINKIMSKGGSALLMMHSDLAVTEAAVKDMHANFAGPVGAYPNAGYWQRPQWTFVDQVSPADYVKSARTWIAAGAQIIGGCCGIGPDHIRALNEELRR
ncbi:MAG: homocysteine S-methyltransferase family protein [Hyphomicrobiales bacterium]|nr:homocysteine S-methyltransferase family protein [Hyphomicrobiales bacterium]